MVPLAFGAATVALVGGIIWRSVVVERRRNEQMQETAGALPVFDKGHSRRARRMLKGRLSGRDVALFDYCYVTGGGKSAHRHTQTILLLADGARGLPDFSLSPENFLHRIAEAFGFQDIDFPDFPDFSKHYLLRGADEAAIRRVFNAETLSLLGGTAGWHIQAGGGRLAIFREGRYTETSEIPGFASEAMRIAGGFPVAT